MDPEVMAHQARVLEARLETSPSQSDQQTSSSSPAIKREVQVLGQAHQPTRFKDHSTPHRKPILQPPVAASHSAISTPALSSPCEEGMLRRVTRLQRQHLQGSGVDCFSGTLSTDLFVRDDLPSPSPQPTERAQRRPPSPDLAPNPAALLAETPRAVELSTPTGADVPNALAAPNGAVVPSRRRASASRSTRATLEKPTRSTVDKPTRPTLDKAAVDSAPAKPKPRGKRPRSLDFGACSGATLNAGCADVAAANGTRRGGIARGVPLRPLSATECNRTLASRANKAVPTATHEASDDEDQAESEVEKLPSARGGCSFSGRPFKLPVRFKQEVIVEMEADEIEASRPPRTARARSRGTGQRRGAAPTASRAKCVRSASFAAREQLAAEAPDAASGVAPRVHRFRLLRLSSMPMQRLCLLADPANAHAAPSRLGSFAPERLSSTVPRATTSLHPNQTHTTPVSANVDAADACRKRRPNFTLTVHPTLSDRFEHFRLDSPQPADDCVFIGMRTRPHSPPPPRSVRRCVSASPSFRGSGANARVMAASPKSQRPSTRQPSRRAARTCTPRSRGSSSGTVASGTVGSDELSVEQFLADLDLHGGAALADIDHDSTDEDVGRWAMAHCTDVSPRDRKLVLALSAVTDELDFSALETPSSFVDEFDDEIDEESDEHMAAASWLSQRLSQQLSQQLSEQLSQQASQESSPPTSPSLLRSPLSSRRLFQPSSPQSPSARRDSRPPSSPLSPCGVSNKHASSCAADVSQMLHSLVQLHSTAAPDASTGSHTSLCTTPESCSELDPFFASPEPPIAAARASPPHSPITVPSPPRPVNAGTLSGGTSPLGPSVIGPSLLCNSPVGPSPSGSSGLGSSLPPLSPLHARPTRPGAFFASVSSVPDVITGALAQLHSAVDAGMDDLVVDGFKDSLGDGVTLDDVESIENESKMCDHTSSFCRGSD